MIYTERLASGALLLAEPVDRTDTLCIGYWFNHGSRDEGEGEHGFSHFLEHMLFKGTRSRSAFQIAQEIDRVGGLINAFTEKETTCLYVILPREHVRLAFAILSDMAADSVLDPVEMEKEKAVIVNEIGSVDDSPEEKGHEQYLRRMWGEHPLSRKITGEADEVRAIDRDAIAAFYAERFGPDNLVVAVAGNFDLAEVRDLAAAALSVRGGAAARVARARKPAMARGRPDRRSDASFVADRFTQVQLYAGTSYPLDRDLAHYYTSLVFSTAFGESMSSRLFQRLREEQALCYTVYSFRTFYSDVGQWTVYANATPAQTGKLLAALDAELARLRREPLGALEIDDARSHLVGSMIVAREDMESRMKRLARQHAMIERVLEFDESVAMIRAVGPVEVERFVAAHVRSDAFNLLAYGSRGVARHAGFRFTFYSAMADPTVRCAGPAAELPSYQSAGAAGADLRAHLAEDLVIEAGARAVVPTGLRLEIPEGFEGQVRPRSGLAVKSGVTVLNAPGTIDSDYRGEVGVILVNLGAEPFRVRHGDRIAQLVIAPVTRAGFVRAEEVGGTVRGSGGFGSTGT